MRRRIRAMVAGLTLAALAACGTAGTNPLYEAARQTVQGIGQGQKPAPTLEQQRAAVLSAAAKSQSDAPLLLVELPRSNAVATLVIAAQNGDATTWFDPTGKSITTRGGVVIATRGLGFDLMASDVSGRLAAMKGGPATYRLEQKYLNGEYQLFSIGFDCTATRRGGQMTESCKTASGTIENTFTLRNGAAVAARQWLGGDLGYANLRRVR